MRDCLLAIQGEHRLPKFLFAYADLILLVLGVSSNKKISAKNVSVVK